MKKSVSKEQNKLNLISIINMTGHCVKKFPIECISRHEIFVKIVDFYKRVYTQINI